MKDNWYVLFALVAMGVYITYKILDLPHILII